MAQLANTHPLDAITGAAKMMGHKEKMRGGAEWDAFNRYSRRMYCYLARSKIIKKIKRNFWKRQRTHDRMGKFMEPPEGN